MATHANPKQKGWLRLHELQAQINVELQGLTPEAHEVPLSITNRQLRTILQDAPRDVLWDHYTKVRHLLGTREYFSPLLVEPLAVIAAARFNQTGLNLEEQATLIELAAELAGEPVPR